MKLLLSLLLLAGLMVALVLQRKAVNAEGMEVEALRAELQELHRQSEASRAGNAERSLQPRTTAVLRLRNEVRQLREQSLEVEKLRAANQRLAAELQSGRIGPRRLADMEGAVPRENWTHAGFGTPQATIQSFLMALASGDEARALGCLSPHEEEHMRQQMARDPQRFRGDFMGGLEQFSKLSAFRITSVNIGDDEAMLEVQLSAGGKPIPFTLYKEDNQEWKLKP